MAKVATSVGRLLPGSRAVTASTGGAGGGAPGWRSTVINTCYTIIEAWCTGSNVQVVPI